MSTTTDHRGNYIGGAWVASTGQDSIEVTNPATEQVIARISAGTGADVDRAVQAAAAAFPSWAARPRSERTAYCTAISELFAQRAESLAAVVTSEVGTAIGFSQAIQIGLPTATFGSMAPFAEEIEWDTTIGNSHVLREPVGVVGAITPWNFPLHQIAAKLAPALTAGCTVVLKPSEITPLSAIALVEILDEVGLPPGVVNVVNGTGPVVGEAIAAHPAIDMVTFTGSTAAGRRVSEVAAATVKKVALELGGKNANILLDGADLSKAVPNAVAKGYLNAGQACLAFSRLLVPRGKQAEVEQLIAAQVAALQVGDPTDPATEIGPLVSPTQRKRVTDHIKLALDQGATLVVGGADAPQSLASGYYVQPTVVSDVTPDMTVAREEVFGPVIAIIPYADEDEAIRIANDSIYGLGGGVWGADAQDAARVARQLRTGSVEVNGAEYNPFAPIAGQI
jgi:aldehyde dehydrogenase (NAD+)